jgi:hypothetical protein
VGGWVYLCSASRNSSRETLPLPSLSANLINDMKLLPGETLQPVPRAQSTPQSVLVCADILSISSRSLERVT